MKNYKRISLFLLAVLLLVLMPLQVNAADSEPDWDAVRQVMLQAFSTRADSVNLSEYDIPADQWPSYYFALLDSDCNLWYVSRYASYSPDEDDCVYAAYITYIDADEEQAVRSAANVAISRCVKPGMSDLEKALALHDYLVLNCEYDLTYTRYSAYDALVTGSSVCQGYAEAYGMLLSQVGISAKTATSESMNHAWNLVQLDGSWYHVDVTWDDPIMDTYGYVGHTYFLRSDAMFEELGHFDWVADASCDSTVYDSGAYWTDSRSAVVFLSAQEAIIRRDGMGEFTINSRNLQTGQETLLHHEDESYYVLDGTMWLTVTSGLSYWNGELYFGDLSNLYAMSTDGSQLRKVCSISDFSGWHYFDGTYVKDGTLFASLMMHHGAFAKETLALSSSGEHEHIWINATCTRPKTCVTCGKTEGAALEHTPSTPVRVEPTCTEYGEVSPIICTECSTELEPWQILAPVGHVEEVLPAQEPTCTKSGWTAGTYCTVCGETVIAPEEIGALGHSFDGGTVTKEPTEDEPGIRVYTCITCGATKTEEITSSFGFDVSGDLNREKPTKQQIINAWNAMPYTMDQFAVDPSVTAPYATGKLTEEYLNTGIAYLNYIRLVAGLPEVQHAQELSDNAQYGAVVLAALDILTHYPSQPEGMDDDFYAQGYTATTTSNISMRWGYGNTNYIISSLSGCLADSGSNNLPTVGHRRWLLNPWLLNVGFGHAISEGGSHYIVTKVFDQSGSAVDYEFISWPASGYVPTNLFAGGDPWSVTLNTSLYKKPVLSNLQITLTREEDGTTWSFDASTGGPTTSEYPYLTVNNSGYGISNCIIFSPGSIQIPDYIGVYTVEISGLYSVSGEAATLSYQVEFFDIGPCQHVYQEVVTEPTCNQWGYVHQVCMRCGASSLVEYLEPSDHTWDEGTVIEEPTVDTTGIRLHTCIYCGKEKETEIPKLDHVHSYTPQVTAPTCTEGGYTTYTCSCGDSYIADEVVALGHDSVIDEAKAPTCTQTGLTQGSHCGRCGQVIAVQQTVPAAGHRHIPQVTAPTCTEGGFTTYTCHCGDSYTADFLPALDHNYCDWAVKADPSCTVDGLKIRTCTRCDSFETAPISAPGHAEVPDEAKAPTCTETGLTEGSHCSACGLVIVAQQTVPVAEHSFDDGIVTLEPTEETAGIRTYTCTVCGEEKTETVPALDHTHSHTPEITAPTCDKAGYTTYTCDCGESYTADEVAALEHDAVVDEAKEATCTETGLTEGSHCGRCGAVLVQQQTVKANGHSWGQWVETIAPDATNDGVNTRICATCGETETEVVDNNIFTDVKKDRFEEAILWAYYNGITTGTGDGTTFSPENTCTRKQIVTFLWRAAGEPEPKSMENPFVDVKQDRFEKAILWAYYEGITTGTGDGTTFSPENTCTRKQIVTFLWRYNGEPAPESMDNPFVDVKNDRFAAAILWAAEQGITTGTGDGTTFSPENPCTRKQIVTFLYRNLKEDQ